MPPRKRHVFHATEIQNALSPIGQWIIQRLKGKSFTLVSVASHCGISYRRLSRYVGGKEPFPSDIVKYLMEIFPCTPDEVAEVHKMHASFMSRRRAAALNRPRKTHYSTYLIRRTRP